MNWDFSPQILIQGINQPEAIAYLKQNDWYNSNIVAGVMDEYTEFTWEEIPIFDLVSSALSTQPQIVTSLIFNPSAHVLDACYEAIEAGIKQIVIYSEKITPLDLIKLYHKAENKGVEILGSSQAGILKPQEYNCGINNPQLFPLGNIGMINFAHETIAQEMSVLLQEANLGISTLINLGNRYFTKINWDLWLDTLVQDSNTKSIVITLSEISPLEADQLICALNQIKKKPVMIYLLDTNNWHERMSYRQATVISDQIYNHLYPMSAIELIQKSTFPDNITITDNHYDIVENLK
jgi:succinyl-CoA synthetase alpha subunit